MTRGITFFARGTDSAQLVHAAASAGSWRWPSDMHRYAGGKTRMKDTVVLLLVLLQRLTRDRTSEYPLVLLCLIMNAFSAVLTYAVGRTFWSPPVALATSVLVVLSLWPYQLALFSAHICTAQALALAAVLSFLRAGPDNALLVIMGGVFTGLMLFASASARKYVPMLLAAFLYAQRDALFRGDGVDLRLLVAALGFGGLLIAWLIRARAAAAGRSGGEGGSAAELHTRAGLLGELARLERKAAIASRALVLAGASLLAGAVLSGSPGFYTAQVWLAVGVGMVVVGFTAPDIVEHLKGFAQYWDAPRSLGHFRLYQDRHPEWFRHLDGEYRGAGWRWLPRFFWRLAPLHTAAAVAAAVVLVAAAVTAPDPARRVGLLAVVAVAFSPVLVGELTHGVQFGRTYFPALAGFLLVTGAALSLVEARLAPAASVMGWGIAGLLLAGTAAWNAWVFLTDVWPARMTVPWLHRRLQALGVREFYTYATAYNDSLVGVLADAMPSAYTIHYIRRLTDVERGYIVVPGTSAKALTAESDASAIAGGDFSDDPDLTALIEQRAIERCAAAAFRTFGTSRIWVHESEVTSFRDLILKDITAADRWRGRAWLLRASDCRRALAAGSGAGAQA